MIISTAEAARRLGLTTTRRVVALIAAGRLPAVKLGRDWLIEESALAVVADRKPGNHSGRSRRPAKS